MTKNNNTISNAVDGEESSKSNNVGDSSSYNNTSYLNVVSTFHVPGLYSNFFTPLTLLRMARSELRFDLISSSVAAASKIVDDFYSLLLNVENYYSVQRTLENHQLQMNKKFIIEVEGLDGSGKTTLVQRLVEALHPTQAIATKTPSTCLKEIRPLWDHRGGPLARAFYMISNYILEYEIATSPSMKQYDIVIIDRWYASTCAYTVAYRKDNDNENHNDDEANISDLPDSIFEWPEDLQLKPDLLLVLNIDPKVRQERVNRRSASGVGGASRFNPWDDRLAKDLGLGRRILEAFERIQGPHETYGINANASISEVVEDALSIVRPAYQRHIQPEEYFTSTPLEWWKYSSSQLGLCDPLTGKRCHHALWNLQVSYNYQNNANELLQQGPPILKTVGLDHIDSNCIYYWTPTASFPSLLSSHWASVLWMGGEYPTETQWRAEGYITKVTSDECQLMGYGVPPSLLAHVTACSNTASSGSSVQQQHQDGDEKDYDDDDDLRVTRPDNYDESVENARHQKDKDNKETNNKSDPCCLVRFIPIRIEVLRGGPSTRLPGYPQRWEWSRSRSSNNHGKKRKKPEQQASENDTSYPTSSYWVRRSILPFTTTTLPSSSSPLQPKRYKLLGMTIVLVGTHTSGKSTIGAALAKLVSNNCIFDPELGEILRPTTKEEDGGDGGLVQSGHLYGNGSSTAATTTTTDWDDQIHAAECERDDSTSSSIKNGSNNSMCSSCRVVETWHFGNSAWYQLRQQHKNNCGSGDKDKSSRTTMMDQRYIDAIRTHQETSAVMVVQLKLDSPTTMVQRRQQDSKNRKRLPMKEEQEECDVLFKRLQQDYDGTLQDVTSKLNIPLLQITNEQNGAKAMEDTLKQILTFIQAHYYRRVVVL